MHVLLMTLDEEDRAQAVLATLGTAGVGPFARWAVLPAMELAPGTPAPAGAASA